MLNFHFALSPSSELVPAAAILNMFPVLGEHFEKVYFLRRYGKVDFNKNASALKLGVLTSFQMHWTAERERGQQENGAF